ncbi:hypothetical protein ACXJY6_00030 [Vibrio sp. RC27]
MFEAEDNAKKLNDMGTIAAIRWLCHESTYINKLDCGYRVKEALESIIMKELSQL